MDPVSGSYILQLIAASILGALFYLGVIKEKIKTFFKNILSTKKKNEKAED